MGLRDWHRWRAALAALPAAALLSLAGCDAGGGRPDPDGTVRIAIDEPGGLVPTEVDPAGAGGQVLAALFTPLVGFDPDGRPVPVAAASVAPLPDGRVWTVRLRPGFTFHDGEPVTSDSYLRAWNFGAYQPNRQRNNYYFERIEGYAELNPRDGGTAAARTLSGLVKRDDRTFTIALTEPFRELPAMLGAPAFLPLPRSAFTAGGKLRDGFRHAPVGNGPFRLVDRRPGTRIDVARYPDHPGEPPRVGTVAFLVYPDPARAYRALLAGELDVLTRIPPGRLATVASDLGGRYRQFPGPGFQFLAFPDYQAELADPRIRRAISMAIDRDEIVAGIFRGSQTAARSFVPPIVPGAQPGGCGAACRFDPVAARERYAGAGGPGQLTITFNSDGGHRDWVEATCDQLRSHLPVGCTPRPVPRFSDLLAELARQEPVGMVRLGWAMDYPSMASYLEPVFASDGSANLHGYQNPDLDARLAAAATAGSPAAGLASYRAAEEILARDLPVIPLRFSTHTIGHSPRVRQLTVTRMGQVDLVRIETVR
jgi:peptide/nickel transport system substrate-binding protein/oligopeptide transport system substrate-binding protein